MNAAPPFEVWHVIPNEDLRPHRPTVECWCRPTEDDDDPGVWMHHALDGRERYETGELKLQ